MKLRKSSSAEKIQDDIRDAIEVKESLLRACVKDIEKACWAITSALEKGRKVILFGNGGSAADSQHIAAEFGGRFKKERRALPALALTTNTSSITAIANDYGYEVVFARQLAAFGAAGDVAICISTSGKSQSVIKAAKLARRLKMKTIALTGCDGGNLSKLCDISIIVPSYDTPRIQESHILIGHIICDIVENSLF